MLALSVLALLVATDATTHADGPRTVVVTISNTADNRLLVYDTSGVLVESIPTLGQGGVGGNAGGVATHNGTVAVVNFGTQPVTVFSNGISGFERSEIISTVSPPVSIAFGKDHLHVLGTTTIESHRLGVDGIDAGADGVIALWAADGSAAQVGVVGDQLILDSPVAAQTAGAPIDIAAAGDLLAVVESDAGGVCT